MPAVPAFSDSADRELTVFMEPIPGEKCSLPSPRFLPKSCGPSEEIISPKPELSGVLLEYCRQYPAEEGCYSQITTYR